MSFKDLDVQPCVCSYYSETMMSSAWGLLVQVQHAVQGLRYLPRNHNNGCPCCAGLLNNLAGDGDVVVGG